MSARRRGATGISGVLLVDKPAGPTSHDVVARLRRLTGEGRIGHAGTLDPAATGLLVVLLGPATRLEPYLSAAEKSYEALIAFGSETDTDDAQGEPTQEAEVPTELFEPAHAAEVLARFLGEGRQVPPAYSAIKRDGVVAHRAARAGEALQIEARPITVSEATLTAFDAEASTWTVDFTVSKGTYIRALARDIGRAAGTAAHLAGLRRTSSGPFTLASAHTLNEIEAAAEGGELPSLFADPLAGLGIPEVAGDAAAVANGTRIDVTAPKGASRVAVADSATLHAIYRVDGNTLVAEAVFPGGIPRGQS